MENSLLGQQVQLQNPSRDCNHKHRKADRFQQRLLGSEAAKKDTAANSSHFTPGAVRGGDVNHYWARPLWPRCSSTPGWCCVCSLDPRGWQVGSAPVRGAAPWLGKCLCNSRGATLCLLLQIQSNASASCADAGERGSWSPSWALCPEGDACAYLQDGDLLLLLVAGGEGVCAEKVCSCNNVGGVSRCFLGKRTTVEW